MAMRYSHRTWFRSCTQVALLAFIVLGVLAMTSGCEAKLGKLPLATPLPTPSVSHRANASLAGLVRVHDPGQVTGTLTGPCDARDHGQLPDPRCTPGAYDPAITAAVLCSSSYRTSTYRAPESQTEHFKHDVAEPAYDQHDVSGELDHLISLELGGANDAANLWVEAGSIPNPKDKIEDALHGWVCSATGTGAQRRLRQAQHAIAHNWLTAEAKLGVSG